MTAPSAPAERARAERDAQGLPTPADPIVAAAAYQQTARLLRHIPTDKKAG